MSDAHFLTPILNRSYFPLALTLLLVSSSSFVLFSLEINVIISFISSFGQICGIFKCVFPSSSRATFANTRYEICFLSFQRQRTTTHARLFQVMSLDKRIMPPVAAYSAIGRDLLWLMRTHIIMANRGRLRVGADDLTILEVYPIRDPAVDVFDRRVLCMFCGPCVFLRRLRKYASEK